MDNEPKKLDSTEVDKINSEVKVKTTGLGAIFDHIQQNKQSLAEETKSEGSSWGDKVPLSKLCDIGGGLPKSFRSQRISSYWCEVCQVDLNSEVTYNTHITGAKHKKREKNLQLIGESKEVGDPSIIKANQQTTKKSKKAVIDFRELVKEEKEPIIGLQHVIEIFPDDSGEHDAMYFCDICCCESTAASMFAHVKGFKHRENYLGMKYNFKPTEKKQIIAEAKRVETREGRRLKDLKTIFDEERYPWPPGKRPAHLAQSDDKEIPYDNERLADDDSFTANGNSSELGRDFARRGYNFERHKLADDRVNLKDSAVSDVLTALQASRVKTEDDAEMAHQVAAYLVRALTEYKELTGDPREAKLLRLKSEQILELIFQIRQVQSSSHSAEQARPTSWQGNIVDYGHGQGGEEGSALMHRTPGGGYVTSRRAEGHRRSEEEDDYRRYLGHRSAERRTSDNVGGRSYTDQFSVTRREKYRRTETSHDTYGGYIEREDRGYPEPSSSMPRDTRQDEDEPLFGKRMKRDQGLYMYH